MIWLSNILQSKNHGLPTWSRKKVPSLLEPWCPCASLGQVGGTEHRGFQGDQVGGAKRPTFPVTRCLKVGLQHFITPSYHLIIYRWTMMNMYLHITFIYIIYVCVCLWYMMIYGLSIYYVCVIYLHIIYIYIHIVHNDGLYVHSHSGLYHHHGSESVDIYHVSVISIHKHP